jgi:glutamate carboxypeptidase
MREIAEFCQAHLDWTLETIDALVRLESPTTDKAAVDRCGAELARRLTAIGGRVQPLPRETAGDHLLAEFGCGTSQVLLLGHFDTVWPVGQLARMPCRVDGGRLYGPGAFDMKAGIAIAMLAVRALLETTRPPSSRIVMLWTTDEEMGSGTSRAALEDEAKRSKAVLVLEPSLPGGAVKTSRKGCGEFELIVRGVSAHAGIDPSAGASAVHELAARIVEVSSMPDLPPGASVNVGVVAGGTRGNVVAEEARAVVDVRVPTMDAARRVEDRIRGLGTATPRTTIEVRGGVSRPPLERSRAVIRLYEVARAIAADLGHDLGEGGTGGGSDGNFTAALGVPTLDGLGAVGDGAHALHEHVVVEALPWRTAMVAGLIRRVADGTI